jgi:hypothetical protein
VSQIFFKQIILVAQFQAVYATVFHKAGLAYPGPAAPKLADSRLRATDADVGNAIRRVMSNTIFYFLKYMLVPLIIDGATLTKCVRPLTSLSSLFHHTYSVVCSDLKELKNVAIGILVQARVQYHCAFIVQI